MAEKPNNTIEGGVFDFSGPMVLPDYADLYDPSKPQIEEEWRHYSDMWSKHLNRGRGLGANLGSFETVGNDFVRSWQHINPQINRLLMKDWNLLQSQFSTNSPVDNVFRKTLMDNYLAKKGAFDFIPWNSVVRKDPKIPSSRALDIPKGLQASEGSGLIPLESLEIDPKAYPFYDPQKGTLVTRPLSDSRDYLYFQNPQVLAQETESALKFFSLGSSKPSLVDLVKLYNNSRQSADDMIPPEAIPVKPRGQLLRLHNGEPVDVTGFGEKAGDVRVSEYMQLALNPETWAGKDGAAKGYLSLLNAMILKPDPLVEVQEDADPSPAEQYWSSKNKPELRGYSNLYFYLQDEVRKAKWEGLSEEEALKMRQLGGWVAATWANKDGKSSSIPVGEDGLAVRGWGTREFGGHDATSAFDKAVNNQHRLFVARQPSYNDPDSEEAQYDYISGNLSNLAKQISISIQNKVGDAPKAAGEGDLDYSHPAMDALRAGWAMMNEENLLAPTEEDLQELADFAVDWVTWNHLLGRMGKPYVPLSKRGGHYYKKHGEDHLFNFSEDKTGKWTLDVLDELGKFAVKTPDNDFVPAITFRGVHDNLGASLLEARPMQPLGITMTDQSGKQVFKRQSTRADKLDYGAGLKRPQAGYIGASSEGEARPESSESFSEKARQRAAAKANPAGDTDGDGLLTEEERLAGVADPEPDTSFKPTVLKPLHPDRDSSERREGVRKVRRLLRGQKATAADSGFRSELRKSLRLRKP